jgi:ATP-dependent helicase/nuclease subunit B
VLKLEPLDDVAVPPTAASRGNLVHDVLARFVQRYPDALPPDVMTAIVEIGREVFDASPELRDRPDIRSFWWPRFVRAADFLVEWETGRRAMGPVIHPEIGAAHAFPLADGTEFTLTCRADRIEELPSGGLAIIDFKTGAMPGVKEVQVGFSPQLTLEAAMANAGAFKGVAPGRSIDELLYVHLTGGSKSGAERSIEPGDRAATLDELGALHLARLKTLLAELRSGERAFLSRPHPKYARRYAPYDHLARVREWSLVGQDGESAGPGEGNGE